MPDTPTFVVNDRRKFTSDGELRHDTSPAPAEQPPLPASGQPAAVAAGGPQLVSSSELTDLPESAAMEDAGSGLLPPSAEEGVTTLDEFGDDSLPPGPTEEQAAEAARAYEATVDHLDTAIRAADPGGDRLPAMSFERLTQSLYTQALMLLGGAAQPGETPRVDILGARQTIGMLAVIAEKTQGNLAPDEGKLLESALFDLRMGFLEITQALARQAAQRGAGGPGMPPPGAGPRIVR